MTGPLYAIGRFAARHGWLVVGVWIVVAAGLVIAAGVLGKPTNDDLTIPGSDSTKATDLLDAKLPNKANGTVPIAMKSTEGRLDQGAKKAAIKQVVQNYKEDPESARSSAPSATRAPTTSPRTQSTPTSTCRSGTARTRSTRTMRRS